MCLFAALAACATTAPVSPPAPAAAPPSTPAADAATCCPELCGPCSGIDNWGLLTPAARQRLRAEQEAKRARCLELRGAPCPPCPVCPNG